MARPARVPAWPVGPPASALPQRAAADLPALRDLGMAPLVEALRALASHRLDPDLWVRCAREALPDGCLSAATERDVRRLVIIAATMLDACAPCVLCTNARDALARRVAMRLDAARCAGAVGLPRV